MRMLQLLARENSERSILDRLGSVFMREGSEALTRSLLRSRVIQLVESA